MNTRHMNTRIILSAALAAGVFFAAAPMQAQAPALSNSQKLQAKITEQQAQLYALQAQVNVLQAQVKRLQAQARASSPSAVVSPLFQFPNLQIPNYNIAPFQSLDIPGFQSPNGGFQPPNIQTFNAPPAHLFDQRPQPYSNIPPCAITLIDQKTH